MDSAFWVWNLVSNMAYGDRADIVSRALKVKLMTLQGKMLAAVAKEDAQAAAAAKAGGDTSPPLFSST